MLYIPYPFKRCTQCGIEFLPSPKFFHVRKTRNHELRGHCKICDNVANKIYYNNHRKEAKEREYKYRDTHRDEIRSRQKAWAKANPDKVHARERRYRIRHPEKTRDIMRVYRDIHRDEMRKRWREYQKTHPEQIKTHNHNRRARRRSLPCLFTPDDWQHCLDYFGGCCAACGRPRGFWHTIAADHWIPLSLPNNPGTVVTNIIPLCHGQEGCNNSKKNRDPIEWLTDKFGPRKAKQILKRIADYFVWVKEH